MTQSDNYGPSPLHAGMHQFYVMRKASEEYRRNIVFPPYWKRPPMDYAVIRALGKSLPLTCLHCGYNDDLKLYDLCFPTFPPVDGRKCPKCGLDPFLDYEDASMLSAML